MAATITSTGTFSTLGTPSLTTTSPSPPNFPPGTLANTEAIRTHRDTVEERFSQTALAYRTSFQADVDGMQEVMQFVGLFASAYGISTLAAMARIDQIIRADRTTESVESQRVYAP